MQASIAEVSNSDHLTQNFTGMALRLGVCLLLMVWRLCSSFRFISAEVRFADLADCTISSIRVAESRGTYFILDSKCVNCESAHIDLEHTISSKLGPHWSILILIFPR